MTDDSLSISFQVKDKPVTLTLPPPGSARASVFVLGLPKAGSTLMNRILRPLLTQAGLAVVALPNMLNELGIDSRDIPPGLPGIWRPQGYAYTGFRGLIPRLPLPAFAAGRCLLLVRDPRDMVVSQYFSEAFSHRPPGSVVDDGLVREFDAKRQAAQGMALEDYVIGAAERLARSHDELSAQMAAITHRTWRYEDVIFDKRRWTDEMLAWLGISLPDALVARVVAQNDLRPSTEAPDQHVRRVTPGDHREKLSPATIDRLNVILARMLAAHGYS